MKQSHIERIRFHDPQNGFVETLLKKSLSDLFSRGTHVKKAYLVRVSYGFSSDKVIALCLVGGEERAMELVTKVQEIFQELFARSEFLDIVFLTTPQQKEITAISPPFYSAKAPEPLAS